MQCNYQDIVTFDGTFSTNIINLTQADTSSGAVHNFSCEKANTHQTLCISENHKIQKIELQKALRYYLFHTLVSKEGSAVPRTFPTVFVKALSVLEIPQTHTAFCTSFHLSLKRVSHIFASVVFYHSTKNGNRYHN